MRGVEANILHEVVGVSLAPVILALSAFFERAFNAAQKPSIGVIRVVLHEAGRRPCIGVETLHSVLNSFHGKSELARVVLVP
jgi:hypothetical protein